MSAPITRLDDLPITKPERVPLGRQIANIIRNEILYGRLPAGMHIGQQLLCERYGTSRMPVRDALRQLTTEGFVEDDGNGHSVVAPITRADVKDIYLIEGMLHALALRRISERGDQEDIAELMGYHEGMLEAERAGDSDRMADLNWQFHRRINVLARSPKLLAVIRTHSLSIPNDNLRAFPTWAKKVNDEHQAIMDAVRKGQNATVERLMKQHVVSAGDDLIAHLESLGIEMR